MGLFGAVLLGLLPLITLFNQPRALVPPHLRHHPGAIAEWLGAECAPTAPVRQRAWF